MPTSPTNSKVGVQMSNKAYELKIETQLRLQSAMTNYIEAARSAELSDDEIASELDNILFEAGAENIHTYNETDL